MAKVVIMDHPLIQHKIGYIRRKETGTKDFRQTISEIAMLISKARGFKAYEQIARFCIIPESFEAGRELSAKGEVKRKVINEIYKDAIDGLYA